MLDRIRDLVHRRKIPGPCRRSNAKLLEKPFVFILLVSFSLLTKMTKSQGACVPSRISRELHALDKLKTVHAHVKPVAEFSKNAPLALASTSLNSDFF